MQKTTRHKYSIEAMQPADVVEAKKMRLQSWRDIYRNDDLGVTAEWLDTVIKQELSDERMRERLARDVFGWVARDEQGRIIGVSMPFVMEDGTQRVGGLYVDKTWHGKGVGSTLMQRVIEYHDPTKPIVLGVATYNENAKAFYRHWGFEEIPDSTEMFRDKIPTVRMIRKAQTMAQQIIIPTNINPRPERFEIEAASILAEYLGKDAAFIVRESNRTPDITIDGVEWEIKSPLGKSKHTIETQLKRASRQASYVVIDARRCKLHIAKIRSQLSYHGAIKKHIKRIILITKTEAVEEIK